MINLILIILFILLLGCSKEDNSYKEKTLSKISIIEKSLNTQDKNLFTDNIYSLDGNAINFYKIFTLYVSLFKNKKGEKIIELKPFEIKKINNNSVKATVLILNNQIDKTDINNYNQGDEIIKKLIDIGLPDKISLFLKEDDNQDLKLEKVEYPLLYKWIDILNILQNE